MAGRDPQRQLLSLIRDFATEKSQGERRVSDFRKRSMDLRLNLNAANSELEGAKLCKETTEHDLRGSEVELSLTEASIQAQEAKASLLQEEISKIASDVEDLKNEERLSRDNFIHTMYEINMKLRKLQEATIHFFPEASCVEFVSHVGLAGPSES